MRRREVHTREQKSVIVRGELPAQPVRIRVGPYEYEETADRNRRQLLPGVISQGDTLEFLVANEPGELCSRRDLDREMAGNLIDQIARHRVRKRFAADDDADIRAGAREIQSSLSGRATTAHHDNRTAEAGLSRHTRCRVVGANPTECGG